VLQLTQWYGGGPGACVEVIVTDLNRPILVPYSLGPAMKMSDLAPITDRIE
jgi:hypothetical protein